MLATLGHVLLWTLAVFGFIAACGVVGAISDDRKAKRSIAPAEPQSQVVAVAEVAPEPPKPELLHRVVITRKDALKS